MRLCHRFVAPALALLPLAGWAQSPEEACAGRTDVVTQTCLLEQMTEQPGLAPGLACEGDLCRVELECAASAPGSRFCSGSGYEVFLDWDEATGAAFDVYVTEPNGAESWYRICGTCDWPERVEGPLAGLGLFPFPGGAMLEYAVGGVLAEEPALAAAPEDMQAAPEGLEVAANETYRVPADVPAGYFNVRSGPGTIHPVQFTIPAGGGGILRTGECRPSDENPQGSDWCPIAWQGGTGWISTLGLEPE